MLSIDQQRRTEVWVKDRWVGVTSIGLLEAGDRIRMFEPTGEPVIGNNGETEWKVINQPEIMVEPYVE